MQEYKDYQVIYPKDVMAIFQCTYNTALIKMKEVRKSLNKKTCNENNAKGGSYITYKQLKDFYNI